MNTKNDGRDKIGEKRVFFKQTRREAKQCFRQFVNRKMGGEHRY